MYLLSSVRHRRLSSSRSGETKQVWRREAYFYAIFSTEIKLAFTFRGQQKLSDGSHRTQLHKVMQSWVLVVKKYLSLSPGFTLSHWFPDLCMKPCMQVLQLMMSCDEDLAADCTCTFNKSRYCKKEEGRGDEEEIHIPLLYNAELQKTKEEKKPGRDRVNFRRKGDFPEKSGSPQNSRRSKKQVCSTEDLGTSLSWILIPWQVCEVATRAFQAMSCVWSPQTPSGSPENQVTEHPSSRELRVHTFTLNAHSFLPGKCIQRCQKRGQSLSTLEVPPDECSMLQDFSLGWWMQYYKTGPSGEAHKMQERELALRAYGLAFMPLFLEVLQVYRHHKFHRQLAALSAFWKTIYMIFICFSWYRSCEFLSTLYGWGKDCCPFNVLAEKWKPRLKDINQVFVRKEILQHKKK